MDTYLYIEVTGGYELITILRKFSVLNIFKRYYQLI